MRLKMSIVTRAPRRLVAGFVAATLVALGAVVGVAASQPKVAAPLPDARMAQCFVPPGATILASFDMAAASSYRDHIPAIGDLPEMDAVTAPAYVVVMNGPISIPAMHPVGYVDKGPSTNAVCILVGGVPNVYLNVDLSGMKP